MQHVQNAVTAMPLLMSIPAMAGASSVEQHGVLTMSELHQGLIMEAVLLAAAAIFIWLGGYVL